MITIDAQRRVLGSMLIFGLYLAGALFATVSGAHGPAAIVLWALFALSLCVLEWSATLRDKAIGRKVSWPERAVDYAALVALTAFFTLVICGVGALGQGSLGWFGPLLFVSGGLYLACGSFVMVWTLAKAPSDLN